jgi:hypothetical protein
VAAELDGVHVMSEFAEPLGELQPAPRTVPRAVDEQDRCSGWDGHRTQHAVQPPSTVSTWPVT